MSRILRFARPAPGRTAPQKWLNGRWRRYSKPTLAALVASAIVLGDVAVAFGFWAAGCDIKGNISGSGERIFHVPGQKYYSAARISLLRGERWFCSQEAPREAGWRKALL